MSNKEQDHIPNGLRLDDDGMLEMDLSFDGEVVTFYDEEGAIVEMATLCYQEYILKILVHQLIDKDGNEIHPTGITPGHVICHLIQNLHHRHHELAEQSQSQSPFLRELFEALGTEGNNPLSAFPNTSIAEPEEGEIIIHGLYDDTTKH